MFEITTTDNIGKPDTCLIWQMISLPISIIVLHTYNPRVLDRMQITFLRIYLAHIVCLPWKLRTGFRTRPTFRPWSEVFNSQVHLANPRNTYFAEIHKFPSLTHSPSPTAITAEAWHIRRFRAIGKSRLELFLAFTLLLKNFSGED